MECIYIIALTVGTTSSHPSFSYRCCYRKGDDPLNLLFSWAPNSSLFSVFSSLTSPSLLKRGTRRYTKLKRQWTLWNDTRSSTEGKLNLSVSCLYSPKDGMWCSDCFLEGLSGLTSTPSNKSANKQTIKKWIKILLKKVRKRNLVKNI